LGEELRNKYDAHVELFASGRGVYEVVVDGKLIFSKKKLGRFPKAGEIVQIIEE